MILRTLLATGVAAASLFACTDAPPPVATPPSTPPAAASATAAAPVASASRAASAPAPRVVVSTTSVAGVEIGTPAAEAERRLTARLGPPVRSHASDCDGVTSRDLTWGTLRVVLSDEDSPAAVLRGWAVTTGSTRSRYDLPYDVRAGTPIRDARRRIPGAIGYPGEGPTEGQYLLRTDKLPGVFWVSDAGDGTGTVDEVSYRDPSCD